MFTVSRSPTLLATMFRAGGIATLLVVVLAGCATTAPAPTPAARVAAPVVTPAAPPSTQVFVYPTAGQSADLLDRDRYECHAWAVKQSGFDPSEQRVAPHQRVQVISMPPQQSNVPGGAITGAILGAAVSGPHEGGAGAIIGAVAGAMLGAASDSSRAAQATAVRDRYDTRDAQVNARLDQQASDYRRAIGACLEGRGYTVK